ncbi:hypothetical protein ACOSQ2_014817 [Xanthoceras sorbifolium]
METEDITKFCERLSITEDDGPILRMEMPQEQGRKLVSMSLFGKLIANREINREAFRSAMPRIWRPKKELEIEALGGRPSRSNVDEQGQGKKQDVAGTSVNCDEGVDNDAQTGCVFGRGDEGSVEKSNAVDTSIVATILPVSEVVVQQEYVHTVSSAGGNVVTSDAGDPPSFVSVLPVDVKSNVVTDGVYVGSDSKENVVSSSVGCGKDSVYGAFSTSGADSVSFSFGS